MSYLGSDTASGVVSFIGTTATSIINLVKTNRAIDAALSAAAYGRQSTMSYLVEGQEYSQYQAQREMEEARAQAEADWAVESALRDQEKQIEGEIAAARRELLSSRPIATYGGGRPGDNTLWWIIGLGGLGLVVGATFLISKGR
jgi:hypothetical protein